MDYSKGGGQGVASYRSPTGLLQSPHFLCSYLSTIQNKITDLVFAEHAVIFAQSLEVLVMAFEEARGGKTLRLSGLLAHD